jgi:two-component system CheB/CheR fusion protein
VVSLHLEGVGLADDDYRWCHIVAMDITDRKWTEKALRASETFNTTILNSLSESVVVLDVKGIILKVNTAWERFAEDNGAPELARRSVGLSYRNVCLCSAE